MTDLIDRYFNFLEKFGFKGPFRYSFSRELHIDYVKDNLILKIVYDGGYFIHLIKTNQIFPNLMTGSENILEIDSTLKKNYKLDKLDKKKKIFNSVNFVDKNEKTLWYFSKLLIDNSEILSGNLEKLERKFRLFGS